LPVAPKWSATQSFQLGGSWAGAIAASSRWQIQVFANGGTGYYEIMVCVVIFSV
jgi:hypothetical protein